MPGSFTTSSYFSGGVVNSETPGVFSMSVVQVSSTAPVSVSLGSFDLKVKDDALAGVEEDVLSVLAGPPYTS